MSFRHVTWHCLRNISYNVVRRRNKHVAAAVIHRRGRRVAAFNPSTLRDGTIPTIIPFWLQPSVNIRSLSSSAVLRKIIIKTETVRGVLSRIVYADRSSNYAVAILCTEQENAGEEIKLVGDIPNAEKLCEARVPFSARIIRGSHPQYGPQAEIVSDVVLLQDDNQPKQRQTEDVATSKSQSFVQYTSDSARNDAVALAAFLQTFVKGVGTVVAQNIARHVECSTFEEFFKTVKANPESLLQVPKVGKETLREVQKTIEQCLVDPEQDEKSQKMKVWMKLATLLEMQAESATALAGLCDKIEHKINLCLEDSFYIVQKIQGNPYNLANFGMSFGQADKVAASLGFSGTNPIRLQNATYKVLKDGEDTAHERADLVDKVIRFLDKSPAKFNNDATVTSQDVDRAIDEATGPGSLFATQIWPGANSGDGADSLDKEFVMLSHIDQAEVQIVNCIERKLNEEPMFSKEMIQSLIQPLEKNAEHTMYANEQIKAIEQALSNPISTVTGGPGTGKSSIVRGLVDILVDSDLGLKVHLASPTGRAARRLEELCFPHVKRASIYDEYVEEPKVDATTIHRYVDAPTYGDAVFLIIDESSMVDLMLMRDALMHSFDRRCHIVLLGDIDQLPPVGPGAPFRDIMATGIVPTSRLSINHRQGTNDIVQAANRVVRGDDRVPTVQTNVTDLCANKPFQFLAVDDPASIKGVVSDVLKDFVEKKLKLDPIRDAQVLVPMKNGVASCKTLNDRLQSDFNGGAKDGFAFREGDKVVQTRNDYGRDVRNGDIGFVNEVRLDSSKTSFDQLSVTFDGYDGVGVPYDIGDIEDLHLAYALTAHKCQGSEYPVVIVVLSREHSVLLNRHLLYTAITRGKGHVIIVGDVEAYQNAVRRSGLSRRTLLQERFHGRVR